LRDFRFNPLRKFFPGDTMAGMSKLPPRWLVAFPVVCLGLSALLAETFIADHLDHDCHGSDCPVCLQIEAARELLEALSRAGIALFIAAFAAHAGLRLKAPESSRRIQATLITLKIKFST
jgi:hypothetical protein